MVPGTARELTSHSLNCAIPFLFPQCFPVGRKPITADPLCHYGRIKTVSTDFVPAARRNCVQRVYNESHGHPKDGADFLAPMPVARAWSSNSKAVTPRLLLPGAPRRIYSPGAPVEIRAAPEGTEVGYRKSRPYLERPHVRVFSVGDRGPCSVRPA